MSARILILFTALPLLAVVLWRGTVFSPPPLPSEHDPRGVVLWAWERPEDLRFIHLEEVQPAVLVGTLCLVGDDVKARPRMPPITLPLKSRPLAVVRIETDRPRPPSLDQEQRQIAVEWILHWFDSSWAGLQIDFDATISERPFYRALLLDLHRQSDNRPLSITALASWCLGDRWLDDLPLAEAVPMLFRMGADASRVRALLARGEDFQEPLCRSSYGLSSDEPIPRRRPGRRLYLFHPESWTDVAFGDFQRRLTSKEALPR